MRNPQYEETEYPLNFILDRYVDPWSLIHPVWIREYQEEQRTLYGDKSSAREVFKQWNINREYFYSVYNEKLEIGGEIKCKSN